MLLCGQAIAASTSVDDGKKLYNGTVAITGGGSGACSSCHYSGAAPSLAQASAPTPNNHHLASNNPSQITAGIGAGYMSYPSITAAELFKLSMYIGQYKAPVPSNSSISINTSLTNVGTIDVHALLATNGTSGVGQDSGGVTATSGTHGNTSVNVNNPSSTSINYDITYTRTDSFVGTDTFTYKIINPAAPSPASNTITVNLIGISSAATASGVTGQAFSYSIATNGTTSGGSPYSISSGSLPASVSLNTSTGAITGTPSNTEAGVYNVTVAASTTVGTVSKAVVLTVDGITSSSTASGTQGAPIATYQITSQLAASAFGLSSTPAGLSFNTGNGRLTGTPTLSGTFNLTMSATTPSGTQQRALTLTIASAGAPTVSTTPSLSASPTPNWIGTVGTAITNMTVAGNNPPLTAGSFTATGLPPGLSINASSGVISGTPTTSGDYSVNLGVSNSSGAGSLPVVLRVNATAAPTISSSGTASGTVGASATQYTITTDGTNGPIKTTGGYSVLSGALPAGLALNADTGTVSGTPSASGVSNVTLAAENTGNVKGNKAVTFTITPNAVPVISSPSNGSTTALALGAAMTPMAITASNPPLTVFALASGSLPAGISLNTGTGVISGTPTTPSASSAVTLTATNAVGTSAAVTVNFSVGVPAPAACTLTTTANTTATLDLKTCMFPALSPTGMSATLQPAHGTLSISGVIATYTPAANFFGTDSFSAMAHFSGGSTSSAGIVTVTVNGRSDPTQDKAVTGMLTSQIEASIRYARTQISNYGRHLEGLHRRGPSAAPSRPQIHFGASPVDSNTVAATSNKLSNVGTNSATQLPLGAAPASLPIASVLPQVASDLGLNQSPLYGLVTDLVQSHSIDLGRLSSGLDSDTVGKAQPGPKIWVEGVVSFGSRDASGGLSGSDFSSNGVSMGVDHAWNDKLTVGMGMGYAQDTTNIGTDGSKNESRGISLAAYGSYQVGTNGFVDGMLGLGSLDFDMKRYIVPLGTYATSNRKGYQLFGSLGGGLEFRDQTNMVSPYGRLDFSTDRLNEATESGGGTYALNYFTQTNSALQGVLGLRGEAIHATPFGWAIPRARVEWRQDLQNKSEAAISYADQIGGTRYSIAPTGSLQSALVLGIGSEFMFRDGWAVGVDYQLTQASAHESSYALRLKLIKELGAKGLPNLLQGVEQDFHDEKGILVDAGYTWDDNINRAKAGGDVRSDSIYTFNASQTRSISLSGTTRLLLTGTVGGERFQYFNGLSNMSLAGEGVYQYRASSEFDAPTFGAFARVTALKHQAALRDGYRYAIGVSASQPLTDRINGFMALGYNNRSANSAVFQTTDTSLRINLDYALRGNATLYASAEYRDGDIVSTGRSSLENVTIAKVFVQDDAYAGGQFFSYRFGGTTLLTTLGYNLGLGPRDSIDIAWRRVESTPTARPAWATSPNSYITNQVSASYLMRF